MVFLPGYLPVIYYITKYLSMKYRELSEEEIVCLINEGCRADNWNNILVKEGFSAEHISNTYFSGEIKSGVLDLNPQAWQNGDIFRYQ